MRHRNVGASAGLRGTEIEGRRGFLGTSPSLREVRRDPEAAEGGAVASAARRPGVGGRSGGSGSERIAGERRRSWGCVTRAVRSLKSAGRDPRAPVEGADCAPSGW